MTASAQLIDPDALVDVSNYSSLETCVIRPCQSSCKSHSSPRLQPADSELHAGARAHLADPGPAGGGGGTAGGDNRGSGAPVAD